MDLDIKALAMWNQAMTQIKLKSEAAYKDLFSKVVPMGINSDNEWVLGVSDDFFAKFLIDLFGPMLEEILASFDYPTSYTFEYGIYPEIKESNDLVENVVAAEEPTFEPLDLFPDFISSEEESSKNKNLPNVDGITKSIEDITLSANIDKEKIIKKTQALSQQPILRTHTFSHFIVSEENREAFTAAKMVSEEPGLYNPLYIYGNTGTGKTHLIQAVANEAIQNGLKVRYATCEELLNDFLAMLQQKKDVYEFRSAVRDVDILLIDDVHLLSNKKRMQEEFFNMFNTLHMRNKQIILTSDKQPCEIEGLEERLVSRFELGMTTEIIPPDYEARLAILKLMRDEKKNIYKVSDRVLEFIAQNISANVRRLKGAFIRISSYCLLKKTNNVDIEVVENLLEKVLSTEQAAKNVSVDDIQKTVAEYFNLKISDILGCKRPKNIAEPRLIAMYLSRKHTALSLNDIGQLFGKNHATILNATKKVPELLESSNEVKRNVLQIEAILRKR